MFLSLHHRKLSVLLAGHTANDFQLYSRIAFLTLYFTGIVVVTSYSASLLSHVVTNTDEISIQEFQDLLDDGSCRLGVLQHSAQLSYFKVRLSAG
jgi:hypothetical protein